MPADLVAAFAQPVDERAMAPKHELGIAEYGTRRFVEAKEPGRHKAPGVEQIEQARHRVEIVE